MCPTSNTRAYSSDARALVRAFFGLLDQSAFVVDAQRDRIIDLNHAACVQLDQQRHLLLARPWSDVADELNSGLRRVEVSDGLLVVVADEPAHGAPRRGLHTDSLTGLANRDALSACLAAADPQGAKRRLAVFFVDLDGFKQVNDLFGHIVGDQVLRVVAQRLAGTLRPSDLLVRYGGDEFVVVADGLRRPRDLERLARRITRGVRQPISIDGQTLLLSASVGFARRNARLKTMEALIAEADREMYRVKQINRSAATSPDGRMPATESFAARAIR